MSKYDKFYQMPRHISAERQPMAKIDRAAQFAPYAALVGFDREVMEAARLTEGRIELDECEIEELNRRLCRAQDTPNARFEITYFLPDRKKEGGKYITERLSVRELDGYRGELVSEYGKRIPINDIIRIGDPEYEPKE